MLKIARLWLQTVLHSLSVYGDDSYERQDRQLKSLCVNSRIGLTRSGQKLSAASRSM